MPALPFDLPPALAAQAALGPGWADWLARVPVTVTGLVSEWDLAYDGVPSHGFASLVMPVRTAAGEPAMLKVAFPDDESEHEHLALHRWGGHGAVILLRADPHRRALLLERLGQQDLNELEDVEACAVVAELYGRLHGPAPPQLRTLASYVERWSADLARLPRDAPLPRRLVEQAVSLSADLVPDPASTGTMIHADLHYENVLAGDREPWLAIDPKPLSGDPHYEVAPLLWNRWDEVVSGGRVREAVRRRFHTVVDAAGLDEPRARDWTVVRSLHNAMWTLRDAARAGRMLDDQQRHHLTRCIAIAKAVQD